MESVDPYKREPITAAFVSAEFLAAMLCMAFFWFTMVSFDSMAPGSGSSNGRVGSGPAGSDQGGEAVGADVMEQVNNQEPMQLATAGKLIEAERAASALVRKKPHDAVANICAGNVFVLAGAGEDGIRYLKKGVALSHRNRDVVLNYAQKLAQCKHYDEAIAQYKALIAADPKWELPHMELAQLYFAQKQYVEAADELKAVCAISHNNFSARKLRGIALARGNKLKLGLDEYMLANAQEQQFGPPEALKQMLGPNGNTAMDRVIFELQQQITNKPTEYVPKLRLAQLLTYGGNAKDAKELLMDARRLSPNNAEVQRSLAVVMKQLGEDNQALSAFAMSIKLEEQAEKEKAARAQ